ncbi:MAG: hypothetical protein CML56_01135 [Rhodobacteraceae bacterium]|nr:hypothetical protein [Paracoccaceae bacterium]|tara:strand:+ start:266 stop:505 length:240 start_codon:yes stop_codon:yes gene_type:complete
MKAINDLKQGDLVNFHSRAWVFESANKDYKNPGIILKVNLCSLRSEYSTPRITAEVLWSDGKITTEHHGYLELANVKSL